MARRSNQQRLPGLPRQTSGTNTTGQRQNNMAQTRRRSDIGQQSGTDRLRDHWSLSSYSPGESNNAGLTNAIIGAQFINDSDIVICSRIALLLLHNTGR